LPAPAPAAGAPAPAATPAFDTGTANLAAIAALVIYLSFFGMLGYRRGAQRELIVLTVSLLLAFGLQFLSAQVVTLFDRFGKGIAFLTGQEIPEQSALGAWAAANTATLLLLIWLGGVVFTYFVTNRAVRKSKSDGWAAMLGVLNGLVFATIFAPLLTSLIFPDSQIQGPLVQIPVLSFVGNVWQQLSNLITRFWTALGPAATTVFFAAIVFLVLFAAFTLRTSSPRAKS
jgi:ethanolamine transporter EutH